MTLLPIERRWAQGVLESFSDEALVDAIDWASATTFFCRAATWRAAMGVRLGLLFVNFFPLISFKAFKTMIHLPRPERAALLGEMLAHQNYVIRELTLLLKIMVSMMLLGEPKVRGLTGYGRTIPPPNPEQSARSLHKLNVQSGPSSKDVS